MNFFFVKINKYVQSSFHVQAYFKTFDAVVLLEKKVVIFYYL